MSKLWVFILPNGMPYKTEKCEFAPTIRPADGEWERVFRKDELKEIDAIEARIMGLIDAQRPLLDRWYELTGRRKP